MKDHMHVWEKIERGFGEPPKNNLPDPILFPGHKMECCCGTKMFFPDDPKLEPQVIVE
jgi:hypothetical protein